MSTGDLTLEQIQMLDAAHRENRPRLTQRQAHDQLLETMARFLHYQDSGEPNWSEMPTEVFVNESSSLPQVVIDRYRNDGKFHSQVDRAVHAVLEIWQRCSERRSE